jgi:glycine cleavage system H protein
MSSPSTCRFSDSHEWFLAQGQEVTMGITQFAANELTDVTYVQLKSVGTAVKAGEPVGEVESVKTTSEIYAAVAGTITAVNDAAVKDPSLLNSDPFGKGWLVKVQVADVSPLSKLMDAATYDSKHAVH